MEHLEETLDKLLQLEAQSTNHRQDLLKKYSALVLRLSDMIDKSEARVDNINKMIGDLLSLTKEFQQQNATAQQIVTALIEASNAKERRLQRVEQRYDDLESKYSQLLDKYTNLAQQKSVAPLHISQNN